MAVAAPERDLETLLSEWGSWARKTNDRLGYPVTSSISRMVEQVKVFPKAAKEGRSLTANGKQSRSLNVPKIGFVDPQIMAVDRIVADLPGEYKKLISRRYLWGQPDRIAAFELRLERNYYAERANAAVQYVGEQLQYAVSRG